MCGRVIQSSGPVRYAIVDGLEVRDSRVHNYPPHWNGAPSQELLVIKNVGGKLDVINRTVQTLEMVPLRQIKHTPQSRHIFSEANV
jgi:hypothetical protein